MQIKKYLEPDMRRAMRRVSDELGPDAVIISTQKQGEQVEVVAALDYDASLVGELQEGRTAGSNQSAQSSVENAAPKTTATVPEGPHLHDMQEELSRLRGLFEEELSELAWRERGRRQPGRPALQKRLQQLGLSRELCGELLDAGLCSEDVEHSWKQLTSLLANRIPICQQDIMERGGRIAMVGPTGVGKTTTIAKLAARFALRHGRNQVGLICTDRFRVGAQEQLYTFGSLLGVPVQAATSPADLTRSLASFADRKLVLIDTAGMSPRDRDLTEQFLTLSGMGDEVSIYLVLSAIAQQQVLSEAVQVFSQAGLAGAIVTKLDEAASLGPVISTLVQNQIPLAFVGNGQRVPEDMLPARRETMVEDAIQLAVRSLARARQAAAAPGLGQRIHG